VRPAELGLFQVVLQHAVRTNSEHRPEGCIDLRLAEIVMDKVPEQRIDIASLLAASTNSRMLCPPRVPFAG